MDFGHRSFAKMLGLIAALLLGLGGVTATAACPAMSSVMSSATPHSGTPCSGDRQLPAKSCAQVCGMVCETLFPASLSAGIARVDRIGASPRSECGLIPATTGGPEPPPPRG